MVRRVLDVRRAQRLGDHPVEPGPLELVEPLLGLAPGRWSSRVRKHGPLEPAERLLRARRAARRTAGRRTPCRRARAGRRRRTRPESSRRACRCGSWPGGCAPAAPRTRAGRRRRRRAVPRRSRRRARMRSGSCSCIAVDDLGEVAGQRLGVAAGQLDLVAVLEHQAAEPVPLRLEAQAVVLRRVRDPLHALGQHRPHRRHHGKVHVRDPSPRPPAVPGRTELRPGGVPGPLRTGCQHHRVARR